MNALKQYHILYTQTPLLPHFSNQSASNQLETRGYYLITYTQINPNSQNIPRGGYKIRGSGCILQGLDYICTLYSSSYPACIKLQGSSPGQVNNEASLFVASPVMQISCTKFVVDCSLYLASPWTDAAANKLKDYSRYFGV